MLQKCVVPAGYAYNIVSEIVGITPTPCDHNVILSKAVFCLRASMIDLLQACHMSYVPKQKKTATLQQYRHLYSRKSVPCLGQICPGGRRESGHSPCVLREQLSVARTCSILSYPHIYRSSDCKAFDSCPYHTVHSLWS